MVSHLYLHIHCKFPCLSSLIFIFYWYDLFMSILYGLLWTHNKMLNLIVRTFSITHLVGDSSQYSYGTYTWNLGYRLMQKTERLVALGNLDYVKRTCGVHLSLFVQTWKLIWACAGRRGWITNCCFTWVSSNLCYYVSLIYKRNLDVCFQTHQWFFRAEIETYKSLHPSVRVVILKALCDIRVEVS